MQAQGAYYTLVEQQNAHQEENQDANEVVVLNRKSPDGKRRRASTIISLTTSVWSVLYSRRTSTGTENPEEPSDKKKVIENKFI
jgi:mannitol-1-phosphate/altronate dehydrogenase